MPHYSTTPRFRRDLKLLPKAMRTRFVAIVRDHFVPDLEKGRFRPGLRVKRIESTSGVYEMTFAPNGRATWQYGPTIEPGVPHVVWRRVGTHDVLDDS